MDVRIDARDAWVPTPALSHAILTYNRDLAADDPGRADGIVVTPSHNPPRDGGFKYNPPHGGPADTDATGWIADRANALIAAGLEGVARTPFKDIDADVSQSILRVRRSPFLIHTGDVRDFVYDVETHRLREVVA